MYNISMSMLVIEKIMMDWMTCKYILW